MKINLILTSLILLYSHFTLAIHPSEIEGLILSHQKIASYDGETQPARKLIKEFEDLKDLNCISNTLKSSTFVTTALMTGVVLTKATVKIDESKVNLVFGSKNLVTSETTDNFIIVTCDLK